MHSIFNFKVKIKVLMQNGNKNRQENNSWLPILELLCHSSKIVKHMNKSSLNIKIVKLKMVISACKV